MLERMFIEERILLFILVCMVKCLLLELKKGLLLSLLLLLLLLLLLSLFFYFFFNLILHFFFFPPLLRKPSPSPSSSLSVRQISSFTNSSFPPFPLSPSFPFFFLPLFLYFRNKKIMNVREIPLEMPERGFKVSIIITIISLFFFFFFLFLSSFLNLFSGPPPFH